MTEIKEVVKLSNIPLKLSAESVLKRMRLHRVNNRIEETVKELIGTAHSVARPRALYRISCTGRLDDNSVEIDGVRFTSRVLSKNLRNLNTVFPFIATCGKEMDEVEVPAGDMMRYICLDAVKTAVLFSAVQYLSDFLRKKYALEQLSTMNPGEIEDFPLSQQKPLFSLFGDVKKSIGVTLMAGEIMKPLKSRSGIYFSSEQDFTSCQLCTQKRCPGRRAAYNPVLVKEYMGEAA